ncbi:hypothetical protein NC651_019761 [Populus alba x Populus x berolinensis]|nr:hypothetical protein NC651_019761 [Populus alba x Populus x berolinensis]
MRTLEKRGNVYILTSTGNDEHRLNPTGQHSSTQSDQHSAASAPNPPPLPPMMPSKLRGLVSDHISLPMPTIAAITGHASAGGWSMLCVVIMRRDRGFLYMSELDIGLVVPAWFMAWLECKFGDLKARRDVVLKAAKLTAEKGFVDMVVGNAEESVEAAVGLGRIRVCLETVVG